MSVGVLQAMYMQQDALEGLVRVLTGDDKYKIELEPEAARIRQVRHDAVGHPTKQGGTNIKRNGQPNEQVSHAVVRHSMETARFEVMRSSNLSAPRVVKIDMLRLIDANRELATRVLARVKTRLEELEMAHREEFKSEKLRDIFHSSMAGCHLSRVQHSVNPKERRDKAEGCPLSESSAGSPVGCG